MAGQADGDGAEDTVPGLWRTSGNDRDGEQNRLGTALLGQALYRGVKIHEHIDRDLRDMIELLPRIGIPTKRFTQAIQKPSRDRYRGDSTLFLRRRDNSTWLMDMAPVQAIPHRSTIGPNIRPLRAAAD